ncbi:MAG: hypothetical protein IIZ27_06855 [Solobacterium sp.]|nr:hypothetical protein [Solobacterium sp.]
MGLGLVYLAAGILFAVLLIFLGLQPALLKKLTGYILLFVGVCGIGIYGYGYYTIYENVPVAVMRTLFSVFCMFLGRNEISAIINTPVLKLIPMQILVYLVHLLALYCLASAVAATVGVRLLGRLNLILIHRGNLHLIFGVNDESMEFAHKIQEEKKEIVIFYGDSSAETYNTDILRRGGVLFRDDECKTTDDLLRRLGISKGNRHLSVYCLNTSVSENLRFAEDLRRSLEKQNIDPVQTSLTILCEEEENGQSLQAEGQYGYGSVLAVVQADLISRIMLRECPPYKTIDFKEDGTAEENFDAMIIGFGSLGQSVLRNLVMNAQFCGSEFHATIISPNYTKSAGHFFYRYPGIKKNYSIDFIEDNAKSIEVYDYMAANCRTLNYVAVCTGNDKENHEIAAELQDFLSGIGCKAKIVLCSGTGLSYMVPEIMQIKKVPVYTPEYLCSDAIDARAMILNHQYHLKEEKTIEEDWRNCDYFSRMSCRASADFLDAYLYITGLTKEEAMQDHWYKNDELLENLSITEHMRWCAFHYAMSYQSMPRKVFNQRAEEYKAGKNIRIAKDTVNRYHACLIPWDELDELSRRESEITGKPVDYKDADRDNLRMIPEILKNEANRK